MVQQLSRGSAVVEPRACFLQMSNSISVFIASIRGNVKSHGCPVKILEHQEAKDSKAQIFPTENKLLRSRGNVRLSRAGKSLCIYASGPVAQV